MAPYAHHENSVLGHPQVPERRGLLLLMTLLMLSLFMVAGALMLTVAIRARTAARANFSAIQQSYLANAIPREALDEALLAAIRGAVAASNGSVQAFGGSISSLENLLADKYGESITGTGSGLADTNKPVMRLTLTSASLSPAVPVPSRLNGRILTIKPDANAGDICSFRILGCGDGPGSGQYTVYLSNAPPLSSRQLPTSGSFDVVINGREFTPVTSGTAPESWDAPDDANLWLAQPFVVNGAVSSMNRVSFGGKVKSNGRQLDSSNQSLEVDNDNDGVLDGIWIPRSVTTSGTTPPPFVIADRPSPLGGTLRFQVSYLILDLDGRININATGAASQPGSYPGTPSVPLGMGYGPADIDCSRLFPRTAPDPAVIPTFDPTWSRLLLSGTPTTQPAAPSLSQRRRQPLIGPIDGRFGANAVPGATGDDTAGNQRTSETRYREIVSGTNAVADLQARARVYHTAPSGDSLTPTLNFYRPLANATDEDHINDPYEARLDSGAPRLGIARRDVPATVNDDNMYTLEALERLLRPNDADVTKLPQRLAAGLEGFAQTSRMLITTDSWDSPALKGLAARQIEDYLATTLAAPRLTYSGTAWTSGTASSGGAGRTNPVSPDIASGLKFDVNRPVLSGTSTAARQQQHEYCKGLYTLVRILAGSAVTAEQAAQWAVNALDFRDDDSVCTGFEYDTNIADGWNVDGSLATTTESTRAVVWGAEKPEVLIVETAAWRKSNSPHRELFVTLHRPAQAAVRTKRPAGSTTLDDPVHQSAFGSNLNLSQTHDNVANGSSSGSAIWRLRFDPSKVVEFKRFASFNPARPPNNVMGSTNGMQTGASAGAFPVTLGSDGYLCVCSAAPDPAVYQISASLPRIEIDLSNSGNEDFEMTANSGTVSLERLADPAAAFDATTNPYVTVDTANVTVVDVTGNAPGSKNRRKGPQDSGTNRMAGFWKGGSGEWVAGGTALGKYVTSGTYSGTTISTGTAPVAWFHWPNRPFISQAELMLVASGSSSTNGLLQNYSFPSNSLASGTATVTVSGSAVPIGSLLMDATYVPSRFAGNAVTVSGTDSNVMAVGFDNLQAFQLPRWREPGRVNVNTTVSGAGASADNLVWQLVVGGTYTPNPFAATGPRPAVSASPAIPGNGVIPTIPATPATPADPNGLARPARSTWDTIMLSGTTPYEDFTSSGATLFARDKNPYFAAARAIRLANTTTTTSNVFAVWVTVQITDDSPNAGSPVTKRLFAIVDRSIPVGYRPNQDLNVRDCIRLKRYLD